MSPTPVFRPVLDLNAARSGYRLLSVGTYTMPFAAAPFFFRSSLAPVKGASSRMAEINQQTAQITAAMQTTVMIPDTWLLKKRLPVKIAASSSEPKKPAKRPPIPQRMA